MTTPSRRLSGAPHLSSAGPSRSVLQKLLDEINGEEPHMIRRVTGSLDAQSSPRSRLCSFSHPNSVWVPTSAIAQDARDKLRALDEARYSKHAAHTTNDPKDDLLPTQLRRKSTHSTPQQTDPSIWRMRSASPSFSGVDFASSDTSSEASRTPSPGSIPRPLGTTSPEKIRHTPPHSPELHPKRVCRDVEPDLGPKCPPLSRAPTSYFASSKDIDTQFIDKPHTQSMTSTGWRGRRSFAPSDGSISSGTPTSPSRSGLRLPPGSVPPRTPSQYVWKSDSESEVGTPNAITPTCLRPLQLVDDEKSIYMNRHGED
ncbi:hypothetical protein K491DRAFT_716778 [Lophiostoma macrostomum CBS 122681]|uniref:Uncharacterized protein n=1 Tax=Lophiostoma macrostomum CBS 122681 TaxID=1314788 RepID=A0A6A6T3Y1_9PLEO|nr:hypothetical protein K491DRAFT_716778 [Lophiostoma macrostomum CBS 122681]